LLHEQNIEAIQAMVMSIAPLPMVLSPVLLDPFGSGARSGAGPSAEAEYMRVWGRQVRRWRTHSVLDGLDLIDIGLGTDTRQPSILIHPRCKRLIEAFYGYEREKQSGVFLDKPRDPNHPHEDCMDALRGAVADTWPQGRRPQPEFRRIHASKFF
jgi:hypothetical protein